MARAWLLLAGQSFGSGALYWHMLPIYRLLLEGVVSPGVPATTLLWGLGAVLLVQACYWTRLRSLPAWATPDWPLTGHVLIFAGRLSFTLAGGTFSTVFLVRFDQVHFAPGRGALLLAVLFSMFCFTQELERLGQAFLRATLARGAGNRGGAPPSAAPPAPGPPPDHTPQLR